MNKKQYKRLLTLRKSEEEMFYQLLKLSKKTPRELIKELPINEKRALYLLQKWTRRGMYGYRTTIDLGWVKEPKQYNIYGKEEELK